LNSDEASKRPIFEAPEALLSAVGAVLGPTAWRAVGQDRIDLFAVATDDHQWIHCDVERAGESPFGITIAHGYLTLSLFSAFLPDLLEVRRCAMSVNVGLNRLRFVAPVPAGGRLRARAKLLSAFEKGGGVEVILSVTMELEDSSRPACVLEPVIRFYPEQ